MSDSLRPHRLWPTRALCPSDFSGKNTGVGCQFFQKVKHLPAMRETQVRSLGREDLLEKKMATHSSILAWKIQTQLRLHVLSLFFLFSRGIEPGSLALQVDSLLTMPPVWQDTKSSTHKYPSSHYPMHQERGKE